jgi:anti-sigma factor RsiW
MTIHPSFKSLLAYQDRQLNLKSAQKVGRHLAVCSRCRQDVAQIDAERQTVDALCRDGAPTEVPPFAAVFETIRVKVAETRMAENRRPWPNFWALLLQKIIRTPLVGFALAMLLLMSFNTLVFTGLLLHPLYAVPAPTLLPVIVACMVPAYLAARRAARRFAYTHKPL